MAVTRVIDLFELILLLIYEQQQALERIVIKVC
jgi:hypothetical protein